MSTVVNSDEVIDVLQSRADALDDIARRLGPRQGAQLARLAEGVRVAVEAVRERWGDVTPPEPVQNPETPLMGRRAVEAVTRPRAASQGRRGPVRAG